MNTTEIQEHLARCTYAEVREAYGAEFAAGRKANAEIAYNEICKRSMSHDADSTNPHNVAQSTKTTEYAHNQSVA